MKRRTEQERIAALEARIAAIKARAAMRDDPNARRLKKVLRAIDVALDEVDKGDARSALERARAEIAEFVPQRGVITAAARGPSAGGRGRGSIPDMTDALMAHMNRNPGQRGEEIAEALGTDTRTMRPTMRKLIDGGKVRTEGKSRGTSYFVR
jgi:hypothetical protein